MSGEIKREISCLKCRNFWVAISILAICSFIVLGFAVLGFELEFKINQYFIVQGLQYGLIGTGLIILGIITYKKIKNYCGKKEFEVRDELDLILGCISAFAFIILIGLLAYSVPVELVEQGLISIQNDEERVIAIKNLGCKEFVFNIDFNSNPNRSQDLRNYMYRLVLWNEDRGENSEFRLNYDSRDSNDKYLESLQSDKKWIKEKYLECKKND